jgi:gamma-glutamyltranspeptidase
MDLHDTDGDADVTVPLTSAEDGEADLDAGGVVDSGFVATETGARARPRGLFPAHGAPQSPSLLRSWAAGAGKPLGALEALFHALWRRLPATWSCERDPDVALRSMSLLVAFLALCVFIFALPSFLHRLAPAAITPPGTAPVLDSGASLVAGERGAVAADNAECSRLGVKVLRDLGGNAIDAAVATLLCQGVLAPVASGLGGGAIILVHFAGNDSMPANTSIIDAHMVAPAAIRKTSFLKNKTASIWGGLAVAVPGELRGLEMAHRLWGRVPWKELVDPVADIAEEATVSPLLARRIAMLNKTIFASPSLTAMFTKGDTGAQKDPDAAVPEAASTEKEDKRKAAESALEVPGVRRKVAEDPKGGKEDLGVKPDELPVASSNMTGTGSSNSTKSAVLLREGDKLSNPALVAALREVANGGADVFYSEWAELLAQEVVTEGGVMQAADFASYKPILRRPITSFYHGLKVAGAPPPSSGGACVAMALNILEGLEFRKHGRNGPTYRMFVETLKFVFSARARLGDPAFVPRVRGVLKKMLSKEGAMTVRAEIEYDSAKTHEPGFYSRDGILGVSSSLRDGGTTHVSIIDADGHAVSVTSTINLPFGAGFVSEKTGVVYNNGMDSFSTARSAGQGGSGLQSSSSFRENEVMPGKRPLSSMSPTIVLHNDVPYLVIGGSGGPRIISSTLQTLLNVIDWGDSLGDAISAPRLHHQLIPNVVSMESMRPESCELYRALTRPSGSLPGGSWSYWPSVCKALKAASHNVTGPVLDGAVLAVQAITGERRSDGELGKRRLFASSDPRKIGLAAAY